VDFEIENKETKNLSDDDWIKILNKCNWRLLLNQHFFSVKNQVIKEGLPKSIRVQVWKKLAQIESLKKKFKKFDYKTNSLSIQQKDSQQIEKDVT